MKGYLNDKPMGTFHSIDELIKTLDRENILLKEMFAKRHSLQFRYDYALEHARGLPYLAIAGVWLEMFFRRMDFRLQPLVNMIHHYRRGYEQEGYIR